MRSRSRRSPTRCSPSSGTTATPSTWNGSSTGTAARASRSASSRPARSPSPPPRPPPPPTGTRPRWRPSTCSRLSTVDVIRLHVTEPDQAREICGRVYYPHRLTLLHEPARFTMSLSALNLGSVAVGLLGYAGEVCLETAELETGYEVNVPLSGRLLTRSGDRKST